MSLPDPSKASPAQCPRCGTILAPGGPTELCPRCLLVAAAQDTAAPAATAGESPTLAQVAAAFPQFEVLEFLGRGGMGCVYRVRQPHLDRMVALKLLPQALAASAGFVERFTREARVLARLNHPNIVAIYDFGQCGGFCHLVMEYVEGANLRQALRSGGFTPAQALAIIPGICEALQYAHSEGVLHRDIKPENILIDTRGRVKLVDFGVAKLVGDARSDFTLTSTGAPLGTPHYMAPEQVESPAAVDHRADIFSLGVVFYEMLTGGLPLGRFPAPSIKTSMDPRIDDVVFRALEKEKERRQQSADEVRTEVEGIASTPGVARAAVPGTTPAPAPAAGKNTSDAFLPRLAGGLGIGAALAVVLTVCAGFGGRVQLEQLLVLLSSTWMPGIGALVLGAWLKGQPTSADDRRSRWLWWSRYAWPSAMGLAVLGWMTHGNLIPILLLLGIAGLGFLLWRTIRRMRSTGLAFRWPTLKEVGWGFGGVLALGMLFALPRGIENRGLPPRESEISTFLTGDLRRSELRIETPINERLRISLRWQTNGVLVEQPLWSDVVECEKGAANLARCELWRESTSLPGTTKLIWIWGEGTDCRQEFWVSLPPGEPLNGVPATDLLRLPPGSHLNRWLLRSDMNFGMEDQSPTWGVRADIQLVPREISLVHEGVERKLWTGLASTNLPATNLLSLLPIRSLDSIGPVRIYSRTGGSRLVKLQSQPDLILHLEAGDRVEVSTVLSDAQPSQASTPETVVIHGAVARTIELGRGSRSLTDTLLGLDLGPNARLDRVILRRADGSQSTNDVQRWLTENNRTADIQLKAGDRVEIPTKPVRF